MVMDPMGVKGAIAANLYPNCSAARRTRLDLPDMPA